MFRKIVIKYIMQKYTKYGKNDESDQIIYIIIKKKKRMDRHFPLFPYAFMDGFIYLAQYSPTGSADPLIRRGRIFTLLLL